MKKYLCLLIFTLVLSSCSNANNSGLTDKNIVQEFGIIDDSDSMTNLVADVNDIGIVTELSTQLIKGTVLSVENVEVTETRLFNFEYSIKVDEIYMDVNNRLSVGDIINVASGEGIAKAKDLAELVKDTERAKKYGILQGEYTDNDYILCSNYDCIPIEVGKTYIMYLTDIYIDSHNVFTESGYYFLYEVTGGKIYTGKRVVRSEKSEEKILNELKAAVSKRTGRSDEIGQSAYLREVGQKQIEASIAKAQKQQAVK